MNAVAENFCGNSSVYFATGWSFAASSCTVSSESPVHRAIVSSGKFPLRSRSYYLASESSFELNSFSDTETNSFSFVSDGIKKYE